MQHKWQERHINIYNSQSDPRNDVSVTVIVTEEEGDSLVNSGPVGRYLEAGTTVLVSVLCW